MVALIKLTYKINRIEKRQRERGEREREKLFRNGKIIHKNEFCFDISNGKKKREIKQNKCCVSANSFMQKGFDKVTL